MTEEHPGCEWGTWHVEKTRHACSRNSRLISLLIGQFVCILKMIKCYFQEAE